MYPEEYRFKEFKENKHMRAGCVHYFLGQSSIAKSIKYMGPMGYSHVKIRTVHHENIRYNLPIF